MNHLAKRKKYVPDLQKMQAICSRNYALLLRLLPVDYKQNNEWNFVIGTGLEFSLKVTDVSVYTETFELCQTNLNLPKALTTNLEFKLYHDAQMAEVTRFQNRDRLRATYPYPNPDLHQKDEKHQVNSLLQDWLDLAISHRAKTTEFNSPLI